MRMDGERQSDNVEDRRGGGGGGGGFGGGGVRLGGGIGIGTIVLALLASWIFGINPLAVIGMMGGGGGGGPVVSAPAPSPQVGPVPPAARPPADDPQATFVRQVLASTEDVWAAQFKQRNAVYQPPKLVLYTRGTRTACGVGQAAMGPFYCPADRSVYLDMSFFRTMRDRLGAPGEFAAAYVIAHEVGHHVQHLLGITDRIDAQRDRLPEAQANALSVRIELQADCLAGIWARQADQSRRILEEGDIEAAMNAAAQIGDDTLQQLSTGVVQPESFTHGTSAQRVGWFKRGFSSGNVAQCNTFETTRR